MASTAGPGYMLPEQVWDLQPPAGHDGLRPGTPTVSATPLAWTHAQFLRLARDVDAGKCSSSPPSSHIATEEHGSRPLTGTFGRMPPNVTLLQLEHFVAAVEHGSFSAAAAASHVAQPSLSEQIRRLEDRRAVPGCARADARPQLRRGRGRRP